MCLTKFGKPVLGILMLTILLSACGIIQTSPKYAYKGTTTKTPFQIKSTYTPTLEPPPTFTPSDTSTPTPKFTPTYTATETPGDTETPTPEPTTTTPLPTATVMSTKNNNEDTDQPTVKVSLATNCRTGPGIGYYILSVLKVGEPGQLVGRDQYGNYWIIKDPRKTGKECWLWSYYATTSGNTKNLQVYFYPSQPTANNTKTPVPTFAKTTPAPTKTPKPTSTPKTPLPTDTPNLTPGTPTDTPKPATETQVPSNTPIPSNTPDSGYCPYTSVLTGEEEKIKKLINQARANRGLPKLQIKVSLVEAARDHGRDMTCHGTYSHTSTDGRKAWERISVALGHSSNWCYNHCCCSEIFYGGGSYLTPEIAFDWWMNHPSQDPNYKDNIHKRTILSQYSTKLGVCVIYYQHNGTIRKFYTVDFAKP